MLNSEKHLKKTSMREELRSNFPFFLPVCINKIEREFTNEKTFDVKSVIEPIKSACLNQPLKFVMY